jgi:hypothetical protein
LSQKIFLNQIVCLWPNDLNIRGVIYWPRVMSLLSFTILDLFQSDKDSILNVTVTLSFWHTKLKITCMMYNVSIKFYKTSLIPFGQGFHILCHCDLDIWPNVKFIFWSWPTSLQSMTAHLKVIKLLSGHWCVKQTV